MWLLQVTALFFLLSNSLCRGGDSQDVQNNSTPTLTETSTTNPSATTPGTASVTDLNKSTDGIPPEGTTKSEVSKTSLVPAIKSLTTPKHEVETTTEGLLKNEGSTIKTTVSSTPIANANSTLPSSQNKTDNQSSIRTTEISVATQLPDASPKATAIPSASLTTAHTMSPLQDTEDGKITATPSNTPSYSSIILPVVIALIVITLLVFTLVGLYRICWKRDPGTPENGNDHQPQSDKESVKLLTVKTISHESGEHSAQGKTKN
ncbi:endomucin [Mus pahari]|uniref:endomucin n=1 Tax=Mus pahari TaxID=10093 RepID=UPI000FC5D318|nr:endomucin [Mus pahari]